VLAKAPFGVAAARATVAGAGGRQRTLNLRAANGHAVVPGARHPHGDGHNH